MTAATIPPGCRPLVESLTLNGWNFKLDHAADDGGHPYLTIKGRRGNDLIAVIWRTRDTGAYRVDSLTVNEWEVFGLHQIMQAVAA